MEYQFLLQYLQTFYFFWQIEKLSIVIHHIKYNNINLYQSLVLTFDETIVLFDYQLLLNNCNQRYTI